MDLGSVADYLRNFYELKVRGIMGGQPEGVLIPFSDINLERRFDELRSRHQARELICEGVGLGSNSNELERAVRQSNRRRARE